MKLVEAVLTTPEPGPVNVKLFAGTKGVMPLEGGDSLPAPAALVALTVNV